jgi:polyhydroxyalkanoate synthase
MAETTVQPAPRRPSVLGRGLRVLRTLSSTTADEVDVGTAPKEEAHRQGKLVLYRYRPVAERSVRTPVLIVYSLANRYYMMDLQEDRSLIRGLLRAGVDVYLIDWGYPTAHDRWLDFDDYVNGHIAGCHEVIARRSGTPSINVLGVCMGGLLSLCFAALHPERVNALVTMGTAVDYHADEPRLNRWTRDVDFDRMIGALGNVPGDLLNLGFFSRSPFRRNLRKYVDMLDAFATREGALNFLRMEKWTYDSPDQAGAAFGQWVRDCCQRNRLIRGELCVGDGCVDLGRISMPVLNIFAEKDDLVPPAQSRALRGCVGTRDYRELSYPVGHIGLYVSGKVQRDLPVQIAAWLRERERPPDGR